MAYNPLKTESYANLGGMNEKASRYITGSNECLSILNFDFSRPGSYSSRPGSTQYLANFTASITSFYEFSRLSGASYKLFGYSNSLLAWDGTTARILRTMGVSAGGGFSAATRNLLNFVSFVDRCFVAGEDNDFFKTDGSSCFNFSLPPVPASGTLSGVAHNFGGSYSGFTGWHFYGWAYLNDRGYIGPVGVSYFNSSRGWIPTPNTTDWIAVRPPATPTAGDIAAYGITAYVLFRSGEYGSADNSQLPTVFPPSMYAIAVIGLSAAVNGFTDLINASIPGFSLAAGITPTNQSLWFTLSPRYQEVYNNSLFLFGFSSLPSTVYFSNVGEPEAIGVTASFEVRTNDGDRLTGGKAYGSQLMLFKFKSFHAVSGDVPDISLRQVSDQYGCLSHRAIVTFEDKCLFLDQKGIVRYNGANIDLITNRLESTFRQMNVNSAIDNAVMTHVKDRNEVWTLFPKGTTLNNWLVVYDYLADSLTEWQLSNAACLGIAAGPSNLLVPFSGNYSGSITYYDNSLLNDSGTGFTLSFTSRYMGGQGNEMGYSVEKLFRRLWLDMEVGATQSLLVNFFADGSSTPILSRTITNAGQTFQNRIDFGIPAKSLAFQVITNTPNDPVGSSTPSILRFNGFTVEYRYQRNV